MTTKPIHIVTGAFGYSGRYIAKRLLDAGLEVRTLTNSLQCPDPFRKQVKAFPLDFKNETLLVRSLEGGSVLYNTYWVRFNYSTFSYLEAERNTLKLFKAAQKAGIKRIVHISITNPDEHSSLEYFRGKGRIEKALMKTGLSYAILRPAVLFGKEGILINNIAWMLRKFPVFGVFGDGTYRLQPIYVDDLAQLAVEMGMSHEENTIIDAIGPETFAYKDLVKTIGKIIGKPRPIVSIPDKAGYLIAKLIGKAVGDIVITADEIEGLKAGLLCTTSKPIGQTPLTVWAGENASTLGIRYASELSRRA
jgi:NADH dehydrogenase